jgi:hypothetical protein
VGRTTRKSFRKGWGQLGVVHGVSTEKRPCDGLPVRRLGGLLGGACRSIHIPADSHPPPVASCLGKCPEHENTFGAVARAGSGVETMRAGTAIGLRKVGPCPLECRSIYSAVLAAADERTAADAHRSAVFLASPYGAGGRSGEVVQVALATQRAKVL